VFNEIGYEGQLKLKNSKVCLVGLGGLGTPTALKLTAMGIGYLRLIDRDIVARSDLQRQYLYDTKAVGYPKVEAAAERLKSINPDVEVDPVPAALTSTNASEIIADTDIVIDGLDTISSRYILNSACLELDIPYVFGAAIESVGNVSTVIPHKTACLECFYPGIEDNQLPKCAIVGVHPSVLGIVSSIQVYDAVRLLTGKEPRLANKLLYIDLHNLAFDIINLRREESCLACGTGARAKATPVGDWSIEEACGRAGNAILILTPNRVIDLDLDALEARLRKDNKRILVKSKLGLTFLFDKDLELSLLKSGVAIAQIPSRSYNPESKHRLIMVYNSLVEC
jgi:adenylyltransferase/sulfurtransferase